MWSLCLGCFVCRLAAMVVHQLCGLSRFACPPCELRCFVVSWYIFSRGCSTAQHPKSSTCIPSNIVFSIPRKNELNQRTRPRLCSLDLFFSLTSFHSSTAFTSPGAAQLPSDPVQQRRRARRADVYAALPASGKLEPSHRRWRGGRNVPYRVMDQRKPFHLSMLCVC